MLQLPLISVLQAKFTYAQIRKTQTHVVHRVAPVPQGGLTLASSGANLKEGLLRPTMWGINHVI